MDKLVWNKAAVDGYEAIARDAPPGVMTAIDDALDVIEFNIEKGARLSRMYDKPIPMLLLRVHPRDPSPLAYFIGWRRIPGGAEVISIRDVLE